MKGKVLAKEEINGEVNDFQGLWISSACYLVYNRYSEVGDVKYWHTPEDIENYLRNEFKQHSLNNPIVEKVLVETLQIVKDIWCWFGSRDSNGVYKKLFDKIHIELGREVKKNTREREKEYKKNQENKRTNERIYELLKELIGEQKAKSPFQQEKLRILEGDILSSIEYDKDSTEYQLRNGKITKKEIKEIIKENPKKIKRSDFERYRLWLDQRYQSPYTGKFIKLSDLFDRTKYEIEHVFPQERITLNAFSNKVLCETEVNKAKKAVTGYQFILNCKGVRKIRCAAHKEEVAILSPEDYTAFVKSNFTDKKKQEILLSREIPDEFTDSQLNNAKYIAKMAMKLLSNIVREEGEDSYRSKNVLPITGTVTSKLKRDWQLNEAWNTLITPRFTRLNELTDSNLFGTVRKIDGHDVFVPDVPEQLRTKYDPKRIDHRHHAMDALIIALATENHVNYLNNSSAQDSKDKKLKERYDIKEKYMTTKKNEDGDKSRFFLPPLQYKKDGNVIEYTYQYKETESRVFKTAVIDALKNTIVSFKQKKRVIRQRTNKIQSWNEGKGTFEFVPQENLNKKQNYNVRQSLHKATFYGKVRLSQKTKEVSLFDALSDVDKIVDADLRNRIIELKDNQNLHPIEIANKLNTQNPKVEIYEDFVATRYENTLESFASVSPDKVIATIESITDTGIQKILKRHLENYSSVKRSIKSSIEYVNIVVNDEHRKVIKELLKENIPFESIEVDNRKIIETEIFTKELLLSEEEKDQVIMNPQLAFSFEGIRELNRSMKELNNGKNHKPIYKVRMFTPLGTKFPVSEDGTKSNKYVITAADSNLFCGVYASPKGERRFAVPTLKELIENLKNGNDPCQSFVVDEKTGNRFDLLFVLSPNDLVYVPTEDEIKNSSPVNLSNLTTESKSRIYKFTDGNSQGVMNFIPYYIANSLVDLSKDDYKKMKLEKLIFEEISESKKGTVRKSKELVNEVGMGSTQSKNQNSLDGIQIKSVCWKINIDRLGNIIADQKRISLFDSKGKAFTNLPTSKPVKD